MTTQTSGKTAPSKETPGEDIQYGFDVEKGMFFHKKPGEPTAYCSPEELLEATESYQIPKEDRGALLLGIPL